MLKNAELKMLATFFPEGEERTTKEIEKRSGYSHERVHSTLDLLGNKGVLRKKKVGKTSVYSIYEFGDIVYLAFVHYSINQRVGWKEKYPKAAKVIKELMHKTKPGLLVVFGSYARKRAKGGSDVDILCVGGAGIEKTALSLRHKYNLRVNPVLVKGRDFENIKTENPEFWEDLVNFGIILKGEELFYELVYSGK